ncbi:hypothetical protein LCGC14_0961390 [marine sediment metagenome]|uniref:Prophage tail endopeptidase domain-containing protein n=1 Tax=marine sediment metagenome TaxID=412755 RepID=A0A0F9NED6_9ZZZZ
MAKQITIKVYGNTGNYIDTWGDATFKKFTKEINGGLGECVIKLARKFDDYDEFNSVDLNNEVRILISDKDTVDLSGGFKLIYSGYISEYEPWVEGGKEGVTIRCLGYFTKLAADIYKNGTITTITESAVDIGTMFKNVMNRYIAETSNQKLHYDQATIRTTGTTGTYTFESRSYREAIDVIKSLAPADWWWYVNEHHEVLFKPKPTTVTHDFIFGRHFHSVRVRKSMEKVKNAVLFYNTDAGSPIYKLYIDQASINKLGRRIHRIFDQDRVGASGDADKIGQGFVSEHKNPDIKVLVDILDNNEDSKFGYDIESINPGDTCTFFGFDEKLNETFKEAMIITKVIYSLSKVGLVVEPLKSSIVDEVDRASKGIDDINSKDIPSVYST